MAPGRCPAISSNSELTRCVCEPKGVAADELVGRRPWTALWRSQLNAGRLGRRGFGAMADEETQIKEIRRRWAAADAIVQGWGALPSARRERVVAELEETAREVRDRDDQFASDLTAALDALDLMGRVGSFDFVAHATTDIRLVLRALDETSGKA